MTALDQARQILDTLLGYLGFVVTIEEDNGEDGPTLQILCEEPDDLIGRRGEVLEDIQYLVNRILLRQDSSAPRIRVDCEYYRSMREDRLLEKVKQQGDRVRATGQPVILNPLNSYYRRLVHNIFAEDPTITSESAAGTLRFKRITLRRRTRSSQSAPESKPQA